MMRTMMPTVTKASAMLTSGSSRDLRPGRQRPARRAHAAFGFAQGRLGARHHQAERALVGAAGRHLAHDAAGEHHQDAVGERQDLVELDRDHQHGAALVAALHQLAMDEFDGADIDAARRLADQQHLGLARHLARQHQLLLVAAGEARRAQAGRARPHVEAFHQRGAMRADRRAVEQVVAAEGRPLLVAQDRRLRRLERRHHALAQAILGHVRQAQIAHLGRIAGMAGIDQPGRAP